MAYGLSFSEAFFVGDEGTDDLPKKSDRPTNVRQALFSMPKDRWNEMCREVFGCEPDYVDLDTALSKVQETDTCSNLDSPVTVWIDEDGFYTVDIYEET